MKVIFQLVPLLAFALHVRAHGVLTAVTGTNGVTGQGFGVDASTPRDGTKRNPFQQDTSIIRDREIKKGDAGVCGRTLAGGDNDVTTQLNAAVAAGLPAAAADGTVTMTLHQVNGDGAGPYTCEVSTDATGADFAAMTVTTNVPGRNSRSNAKATDFSLVAQMPAGATCTGGPNGDACIVRCRNSAAAGPFGGCVAVTNAGSANASSAAAGATDVTASVDAADVTATDAAAASVDASSIVNTADIAATAATDSVAAVSTSAATSGAVTGSTGSSVNSASGTNGEDAVGQNGGFDTNGASAVGANGADGINGANAVVGASANGASRVSANSNAANVNSKASKAGFARATDLEDDEDQDEDEDDEPSIHDAEIALAADLDRRHAERVSRSRIMGRRAL
ncbi:hypothetical protein ACEPAI_4475 [Sanghuangporus weigelae]